jgi:hypothetical protein
MTLEASEVYAGFTPDRGWLDQITPANPAAGTNLTLDLGRQRWIILHSLTVTLTTDANAANRLVCVDILAARNLAVMRNAATVLITANTSLQVIQFDNQHTVSEWNTGTPVFAPLQPVPLQAGWQVRVTVDNIQAGDQLSSCKVLCSRFFARSDET